MNASWVAIDLMEFAVRTEDAVQSPEAALEWLRSFRDTLLMEGRNSRPMPWAVELLGMADIKIAKKSIARMQGQIVKLFGKDCDVDLECSKKYGEKYENLKKILAAATTREAGENVHDGSNSGKLESGTSANHYGPRQAKNGDAATREGAEVVISRESGAAVPTTVSRNMRRVPQTAAATTREGVDVASDRESGCLTRTTGCNPLTADAPTREDGEFKSDSGNAGNLESATSATHYNDQETQISTNSPAGAGVNLDSTHTNKSPDASSGNAEGVNFNGSHNGRSRAVSTSATSGQTIDTTEALDKTGAGEVPPESVSAKPSPALPVPAKKAHGEFGNVLLTDDEFAKLQEKTTNALDLITELDQYIESQGKTRKYKSHYATLLNWSRRKVQESKPQQRYKNINDINQENYEKAMREIEAMCAGEAV